MKERSFDEMIAYFNRRVSEMDIAQDYKMELLGMVTALGYKHEKTAQQWIPCSERLPAYGEDVLISIGGYYCNVGHIVSVNEEEQYNWYFSGWYHLPNDVDAWMPLPEPWRGEEHGATL